MTRALVAAALLACALQAAPAAAQLDDDLIPSGRSWISPERFIVEFRIGPYHPDYNGLSGFRTFFNDDRGPLLGLELDVIAYRIEDLLYFTGGGGIGTAHYSGHTLDASGQDTSEATEFSILPLQLLASVRFDGLARKLSVPFIITGKLGYQWARWSATSGGQDDADGWSVGFLWAAQLGLDLDTFEPSAARNMDEEWGINHSFLFFELFDFEPSSKSLPIGNLAWSAGLGFNF